VSKSLVVGSGSPPKMGFIFGGRREGHAGLELETGTDIETDRLASGRLGRNLRFKDDKRAKSNDTD